MTAGTAQKEETSATITKSAPTQLPGKSFVVPESWQRKAGRTTSMLESFYHATQGILQGLKEQRNLRIHFALSTVVIILGIFLHVDAIS